MYCVVVKRVTHHVSEVYEGTPAHLSPPRGGHTAEIDENLKISMSVARFDPRIGPKWVQNVLSKAETCL